jgi:hypothetical protein
MKQLLLAAAVTLSLATIPALASTNFTVGNGLTSFGSSSLPVDQHKWSSSCSSDPVIISNPGKKYIELLIKVQESHSSPSVANYVQGGDAAIVCCNGYSNTVQPGNYFLCKTKYTVTIKDNGGSGNGAKGYFTENY